MLEKLLSRISISPAGCWEWQGCLSSTGYGQIRYKNRTQYTHRLSFELHHGKIPNGLFVCHSCDNPKCLNPEHLWAGTQKQNVADALNKGRLKIGINNHISKLSPKKINEARALKEKGGQFWGARKFCEVNGISSTALYNAMTGKTWKEVTK